MQNNEQRKWIRPEISTQLGHNVRACPYVENMTTVKSKVRNDYLVDKVDSERSRTIDLTLEPEMSRFI